MESEEGRLRTFLDQSWPSDSPVRPEELASAGFYYTGSGDETKCYMCNRGLTGWETGDDPYDEHKQKYPDCELSKLPKTAPKPIKLRFTGADGGRPQTRTRTEADRPDYSQLIHRHKSYDDWNKKGNLWKQNMALAGFYYTGTGDEVKCYTCDVGLRGWDTKDIPVLEHLKHRSSCSFITSIKQYLHGKPPLTELPEEFSKAVHIKPEASAGSPTQETIPQKLPLRDNAVCIVCQVRPRQVLFEDCNHLVVCEECSAALTNCPHCGRFIIRKTKFKMDNL